MVSQGYDAASAVWGVQERQKIMSASQRKDVAMLKNIYKYLISEGSYHSKHLDHVLLLHNLALHISANDISMEMISRNCNIYHPDWHGDCVMHYAVRGGNLRLVRHIFQKEGPKCLEVINSRHFSLLHTVCAETADERAYEILALLEWLYMQGMSLELQDDNGRTPLIWAANRGSLVCVQWLLSRGAHLGHRDHSGRTAIHMAACSGNEEVCMILCEKGGVNLLKEQTIGEKDSMPPHVAFRRNHFFLWFEMHVWRCMHKVSGKCFIFRNNYTWYYWGMAAFNLLLASVMSYKIYGLAPRWLFLPCTIGGVWLLQAIFWVVAWLSDPGFSRHDVMPDQSYRCSKDIRKDASRRPLSKASKQSATYKLQNLERQLFEVSIKLIGINVHERRYPGKYTGQITECMTRLHHLRDAIYHVMPKVGHERQRGCNPNYTLAVLNGQAKKICLTCRTIRAFRAHHCSECNHCVYKFDHHCIWLDNCVGGGNQRSFIGFVFFCSLFIVLYWVLLVVYTKVIAIDEEQLASHLADRDFDPLHLIKTPLWYLCTASGVLNLLWMSFVGYIFFRTTNAMLTNVTFYEGLRKPPHVQRRFDGRVTNCMWQCGDMTFVRFFKNLAYFGIGSKKGDLTDYQDEYIEVQRLLNSKGRDNPYPSASQGLKN